MIDGREDMTARVPAWDDLRERRVLARIEAELDASGEARPRSRRRMAIAMSATMAVAAALVVFWFARRPEPSELAPALAHVELRARAAAAGTLALPDGSEATLHDGALVEMRVATDAAIGLEQIGGRVRYDVEPGLPRAFTVRAGDVEVRVVGTAFWVEHDGTQVRVAVEHGRVRVARTSGSLVAELGPGEELRLETGALARAEPADDVDTDIEVVDDEPKRTRARKLGKTSDAPAPEIESAAELQARSDEARLRGDAAAAADALRTLIDRHPKDVRVYTARFQLAKVERGRGRHAAAAALFESVVARDPNGSLAEDARAEAAVSWFSAGRHDDARAAAHESLAKHPSGAHATRMQRLLDRMP